MTQERNTVCPVCHKTFKKTTGLKTTIRKGEKYHRLCYDLIQYIGDGHKLEINLQKLPVTPKNTHVKRRRYKKAPKKAAITCKYVNCTKTNRESRGFAHGFCNTHLKIVTVMVQRKLTSWGEIIIRLLPIPAISPLIS